MPSNNPSSFLHYSMAILSAMILTIAPWPDSISVSMPDWVLLVLLHWSLSASNELSIGKAWSIGLLMDVLMGQVLGQYALSYAVSIVLSEQQYKRINAMPLFQQSLFIASLLLLARIFMFWIEKVEYMSLPRYFLVPVLIGGCIWFMMLSLFSKLRFH